MMKSQSDLKKKKHLRVPKDASLIWAVLEREKRSAPLRPRLKDLEELPHNIHHFVICPTPPVSSRGLLAQWTCITYRLPVIHFYNLTPFPGCVHPARSGAILRPRYTFLKKSQSKSHICFFWTTERHANVYRYELGLNQANHISTSKNHKHLGIHTFPSHIPPLSPTQPCTQKSVPSKRHICQHCWRSLKATESCRWDAKWCPPTRHGCKKKRGGYALTRVHLLHCLFFYFIGFGCWFEWSSSRLLISKGSIWAIQMGKLEAEVTWTWS